MTINNNGFREGVYYDNDFENNIYKKVCYRNGAPIWEITIDRAIWYWECFIKNAKVSPKNWHDSRKPIKCLNGFKFKKGVLCQ